MLKHSQLHSKPILGTSTLILGIHLESYKTYFRFKI